MSLWVDRREELKGDAAPGRTHALIIGTSRYKWLPKRDKPAPDPNRKTLGLTEVDICATSALLLATWLRDGFHNPDAPLATIRLCVTPSDEELDKIHGMDSIDKEFIGTSRAKVMQLLIDWNKDCQANRSGIAILYAGGHGLQVPGTKEEALVLLEDFADDPQIFTYSIDIGATRRAMVGPTIAATQLYFADACRLPANTPLLGLGNGAALPLDPTQADSRAASPIYYSALPGMAALGVREKGTFFMQALMEILNLPRPPSKKSSRPLERENWHISVPDLVAPWDQRVKELAAAKEQELKATGINFDMPEQGVRQGGEAGPAVFHVLPSPPKVRIKLEIDPDQVAEKAQAALWLPTRAQRIGDALNCRPKPCEFPLVDAGLYSLDVLADEKTVKGIVVEAEPPETVFKHQIT